MLFNRILALGFISSLVLCEQTVSLAHDGHSHSSLAGVRLVQRAVAQTVSEQNIQPDSVETPIPSVDHSRLGGPTAKAFSVFEPEVSTRADGQHLIVESSGLPTHGMMVGIRAWQQQVPIPQPFTGDNAWRLPLNPSPAGKPISVLAEPLRGAIALAVNGVPIFCALNNRGEDTYLVGELDNWGGHCGRGDDYHYHIAPIHLQDQVGVGNPIAFALDGYPILGLSDANGSVPNNLDSFNGHTHDGHYHYHATKTFPYINGGLHGVVTMQGDQIEQPRDLPVRPGQSPLRGAIITGFEREADTFDLTYEILGEKAHIKYTLLDDTRVEFTEVTSSGESSTKVYQRGRRGGTSIRPYLWLWYGILLMLVLVGMLSVSRKWKRSNATSADPSSKS